MTTDQILQVLATGLPIVCAVLVDGIRTRTRMALVEQRQKWQEDRTDELERRVGRHERDPAHARLRR